MFTAWIHQESPLNIDFGIKNERQNYKIGIVRGYLQREEGERKR
jgi:hypothetical protein